MTYSTLLFGATSILGFNLARLFPEIIVPFCSPGNTSEAVREWPVLQLENSDWVEHTFAQYQSKVLLYCHAVCDVPKCEADPDWAHEINVQHLRRVVEKLPAHIRLVYVSSDHVFGGDGAYHEHSRPCPISVYGQTRVNAEKLVLNRQGSLVIRTGLAIGPSPNGRIGHLDWLRYRSQQHLPITIVEDESRSAVWVTDLAKRVMKFAQSPETGIRHISATRAVSRVELANHLMSILGEPPTFRRESRHQRPAPHLGRVELTSVYGDTLSRPLTSVLDG
ncbi:MAG: sugar nucleotide-binding protein [Nitrospirales bacterium]|nr:sugar nucleotide-binding protein [Nitrospirales bacterium]